MAILFANDGIIAKITLYVKGFLYFSEKISKMDKKMNINNRIKELRLINHLTQEQFGEKLGVQWHKIKDIETGKTKLSIELWTDKGKKPVYKDGDEISIYFRVTKPCYVRLIYRMADGSAILLENNYIVSEKDINKKLSTPTQFIVGEPFGYELLTAFAQCEPFAKLKIKYDKNNIIATDNVELAYKESQEGKYKLNDFAKAELKFVTKE